MPELPGIEEQRNGDSCEDDLQLGEDGVNRIDRWTERAKHAAEMSKTLVYERTGEGDKYLPLIISPENARAAVGGSLEPPFIIANSMREVQPEINLLVSPVSERLFARALEGAPAWTLPSGDDD
jgi:hypothetical protein